MSRLRTVRPLAFATAGGLSVSASMPPWGLWPLAFVGIALLQWSLIDVPRRRARFGRGMLFGVGWFFPSMFWMWFLTPPGYVVAALMFSALHGAAATITPLGGFRGWMALFVRPAAHTLVESIRLFFPFGGVPLATLAIGQTDGPLLRLASLGGVVLLTFVTLLIGAVTAEFAWECVSTRTRPRLRLSEWAAVALLPVLLVATRFGPIRDNDLNFTLPGAPPASISSIALVQGGGEQGTRAIYTDSREVVERHLAATATIEPGVEMVVWPENVIDVPTFATSGERAEIAAQAQRLGAPIAVGITEDVTIDGERRFLNAQVVVEPDGTITSRYDKVRRVPFGEYVPLRGLLEAIGAPTNLVPRNAVAGTEPAVLRTADGITFSTVISWEVFFGGRANEGVERGGTFIVNPTNGSSYTTTILQSQQVASSRLRAVEQDRMVFQVAPTGYSAVVFADGRVAERTNISEQRVLYAPIIPSNSRTLYSYVGDRPFILACLAGLLFAGWRRRRDRLGDKLQAEEPTRLQLQHQGDRAVVDQ